VVLVPSALEDKAMAENERVNGKGGDSQIILLRVAAFTIFLIGLTGLHNTIFIVETPIPKAKRSGIGKLNNPAKRRV